MFCNACGSDIQPNCRYCSQCGRALPASSANHGHRAPLERPRSGRKLGGVCLALANHLNVDVLLVRVLWCVVTVLFAFVLGLLAYLVAWILIPEAPVAVYVPAPAPTSPGA